MVVGLPRRGSTQISRRTRLLAATAATLIIIGGLGSLWVASLLPASYTATDMGVMDMGEVLTAANSGADHAGHTGDGTGGNGRGADRGTPNDVTAFVEHRPGPPDVSVTLTARLERVTLAPDLSLTAYTLNGATPGPTIRARQGDLVEVKLRNESVPEGTTLHWHGLDVPNAMDGVAGVTQDAVWVGQTYAYRFVADQVGTYWYHSHQVSHEQVLRGLLGAIVIIPSEGIAEKVDVTALSHTYAGRRTVNGRIGDTLVPAQAGSTARIRLINTDRAIMPAWVSGAPYQLVALDGTEVNAPTQIQNRSMLVPAGGRADLVVEIPTSGQAVRVELGGAAMIIGPNDSSAPVTPAPSETVDLLSYGAPTDALRKAQGISPDRSFDYKIGRRPGFLNGRPGVYWTVNGNMFPNVPMFMIAEGDIVRMRISNRSGRSHPMHLHGHHVLVVARDGRQATGSPWWTDSLEVKHGETYEVIFRADNPGIWMDHCHNLLHARQGLVAHLMYQGVTTPFRLGRHTANYPE
jgi:FtsP/CotA-like multicopper oxidase with cupredoxin domain